MLKKKGKDGHHSFVPMPGKGLLDRGKQECLSCGMIR